MEKKLYAIYDVSLPMPISLKVAGAFLITGIPWWGLMALLHIPFGTFWILWIFPPIAIGWAASKPIYQKKTLIEFVVSKIRFMFQPKRLAGSRPINYPLDETLELKTKIFKRHPEDTTND